MKEQLKKTLKPKRYQHSLNVADTAVILANRFNYDKEKAYTAGILHDCAKGFDIDSQIKLCKEYGIELDAITLACPAVIHAPLGAEVAKRNYKITDEEILQAIRFHTVGNVGMTKLDKIIYIADMIEPLRDFDGVEILRKMAKEDLDITMLKALEESIIFNAQKQTIIHPDTLNAWNDIILNKE